MSECSLCGKYSEDLHPVSFEHNSNKPTPKEIEQYIGLGDYLDDTEASVAADEFWENCAHICHECFNKYFDWICWWG
jgi:hypothetical protein